MLQGLQPILFSLYKGSAVGRYQHQIAAHQVKLYIEYGVCLLVDTEFRGSTGFYFRRYLLLHRSSISCTGFHTLSISILPQPGCAKVNQLCIFLWPSLEKYATSSDPTMWLCSESATSVGMPTCS